MDKKIVIVKDDQEGLPPWGWGFALIALDVKPAPIGNKNKITRFGNGKSGISKNREAEAYVKRLRTIYHEAAGILALKDETFRKVKLPIDGKRCPLRIDVLYLFSPADRAHGELARSDLDNLNKGTYDALKSGPTQIGFEWGLVSDDCYITEGFTCKGETAATDESPGSKIVIICSRAGIRTGEEMMALPRFLGPLPPYRPDIQASPILRPRTIPGRN